MIINKRSLLTYIKIYKQPAQTVWSLIIPVVFNVQFSNNHRARNLCAIVEPKTEVLLTIDMIDVVGPDLGIVGLLPAQWQLIADAVRECLRLCISETMILYLQFQEICHSERLLEIQELNVLFTLNRACLLSLKQLQHIL